MIKHIIALTLSLAIFSNQASAAGTQQAPVSTVTISGTPTVTLSGNLPLFASTPAFNLSQIAGTALTLGQKTMTASIPVVLSSDQSAVAITNSALTSLAANTPVLGQATMANSSPVTLASNQTALPVTGTFYQSTQPVSNTGTFAVQNTAAIPSGTNTIGSIANTGFNITGTLPAFASTPAFNLTQVGGTALALGQATMTASIPVTIANNQTALPVTGTFYQSTQPVSNGGTFATQISAALPTGANTIGSIANTGFNITGSLPSFASIPTFNMALGGVALAYGQNTMANSLPVTFASNQTTLPVAQPDNLVASGSPYSLAALNATTPWIDTTNYNSIDVSVSGTFVATVNYQTSPDQTIVQNLIGTTSNNYGQATDNYVDSTVASRSLPVRDRYFRAYLNSYTSGTVVLTVTLRSANYQSRSVYVAGATPLTTNGPVAEASTTLTNFPLRVAGYDGTAIRTLKTDTGGQTLSAASATAATGGVSTFSRLLSSAATTNALNVKSTAGRIYKVFACNTTTSVVYIHFTNLATTPVPGTSTVVQSRPLVTNSSATSTNPQCSSFDMNDLGFSYSSGIGYWLSTGASDTDSTAITAGAIIQLEIAYQ